MLKIVYNYKNICYNNYMFDIINENLRILTQKEQENLETFKNMLIEYNKNVNLTSITKDVDFEVKHLFDSIKGEKFFKKGAKCIEIGSGGGFPSIPLMIVRQDLEFTLIESVNKKCVFLNEVIKKLNLNAKVINTRCEELAKNNVYREKFDVVTARAVAKLNTLSEYCIPFLKIGGKFIAYKGELDELNESMNAINVLGGKFIQKEEYFLPLNMGNRKIYIIEKIKETPIKYPRGNGKERSKPL